MEKYLQNTIKRSRLDQAWFDLKRKPKSKLN